MKTLLILLASTAILIAADPVRRIGPRARTNAVPAVPAVPKPQPIYGPQHLIEVIPGVKITVVATNQFSMDQLRRWLIEAARTIK